MFTGWQWADLNDWERVRCKSLVRLLISATVASVAGTHLSGLNESSGKARGWKPRAWRKLKEGRTLARKGRQAGSN